MTRYVLTVPYTFERDEPDRDPLPPRRRDLRERPPRDRRGLPLGEARLPRRRHRARRLPARPEDDPASDEVTQS